MDTPQTPVVQNANPPSSNFQAPPGMDTELDDALNTAFRNSIPQTEEKNETPKQIEKEAPKETPKEQAPVKEPVPEQGGDHKESKEVLPDPESVKADIPKNQAAWNALKGNYKRAHGEISRRDEEIKKLKTDLAERGTKTNQEVEDLKKQIGELSKYRSMIDIQSDPEFISKYDQPIEKSISTVKEMLTGMNVKKEIVDQIDFSNTKLMDEIVGHVGEHKDKFTARKLEREIEKIIDLSDKREETMKEQGGKYQEILEARKKEAFTKGAENEGKMFSHLKTIVDSKDDKGNFRYPFLNKVTPKEGAAEGEIQQIESHNKLVEMINGKIEEALKNDTPEGRTELAVAAGAAHYLSRQLSAAFSIIKGLQEEVKKISTVSSEKEKPTVRSAARNGNGNEAVTTEDAMKQFFNR